MPDHSSDIKQLYAAFLHAQQDCALDGLATSMRDFAPNIRVSMCHPFGEIQGGEAFFDRACKPLLAALPDLERRDLIVVAGTTAEGQTWLGSMGNYVGTFLEPFLDIPPTGHLVHMRYHEFYRMDGGQFVELQAIWDIPELMMQANAWPMAPQLGAFITTPGPMTGDGLNVSGDGQASLDHVIAMLQDLCCFPENSDPSVMRLHDYWHPKMNWYGPAGIGTARGIAGFRHWHQGPFLRGMPNRKLDAQVGLMSHWIGEGRYVCETGWPNMRMSITGDGWMGIAPIGREIFLRSLDFWRLEHGLIRENWVLVDLLDVYRQLGVDVLGRMREFHKVRPPQPLPRLDWRQA